MKTITLTLLLMSCAAWAQSPPAGNDADSASRDALLRQALHQTESAADNNASQTNAAVAATASSNSAPATTDERPRRKRRNASASATNDATVTASTATNTPIVVNASTNTPIVINASTNPVVVTATTNPVVVTAGPAIVPQLPARAAPGAVAQGLTPAPAPLPPPGIPVRNPRAPQALPGAPPGFPQPLAPGALPPAQPAKPPEPILHAGEIDLSQATVDQLLDLYAQLVNRTVLKAPNLPSPQINLRTQTDLTVPEAIEACQSILAMNNISLVDDGDKFVKAVPVAVVGTLAAPFLTNDDKDLPEEDRYITQVVHIKYAKPSELIPVLVPYAQVLNNIFAVDSSGILIIRDYARNVKRMMELIKRIDILAPLQWDSELIPIKYAKVADISAALAALGANTSSFGQAPTGGTRAANTPGGFAPGGAGSGTLGGASYPTPGSIGTPGGAAGLAGNSRTASFNDRLKQLGLQSSGGQSNGILGVTKIIADERQNALLVYASKQDMVEIKKIIQKLDTVLAQVLIDAIIMEVTLDKSQNLGVSYVQNQPSQPGNYFSGIGALNNGTILNPTSFSNSGTNLAGLPSGFSYLAQFGNNFDATLTAIATDSRIHVLSRPRIQTSHAVPASIQIGDTVPYVTGTYFGGINGTASSQYQQTFVGIDMEVTPLINSDGLVVMDISENIQQLGTPTIIDGNPVPTTTQRSASAKVSVRDRDTIILGGFISVTKSHSKSGVPLLKDLPGLGYLFRSTADSYERVELVILLRPTVLYTPEQAALVATHERDKLPNVKRAFAEDQADENKQLKAADKVHVPPERD